METELAPHVDDWEDAGYFPDEVFRRAGELGFLGLHYPERWGGSGGDLAAEVVFVEELAKAGCGAIAMAVSVQTDMATPALAEFGTDDQRERYLRPTITGEKIAAIAITEPDAGSDVAGIKTRGVRDGDTWRIDGAKLYITNGVRADFMTTVVKTDPDAGHAGISLFLVDTDLPGVTVSRKLEKLGMRSSDTAEIALDDVLVPHENLIGLEPGQGFAQLMWQLQYERMSGAAACIGYADAGARRDDRVRARTEGVRASALGSSGDRAQARGRRDGARGRARARVRHGLAAATKRVPGRDDLDGEEVRGAGVQPTR